MDRYNAQELDGRLKSVSWDSSNSSKTSPRSASAHQPFTLICKNDSKSLAQPADEHLDFQHSPHSYKKTHSTVHQGSRYIYNDLEVMQKSYQRTAVNSKAEQHDIKHSKDCLIGIDAGIKAEQPKTLHNTVAMSYAEEEFQPMEANLRATAGKTDSLSNSRMSEGSILYSKDQESSPLVIFDGSKLLDNVQEEGAQPSLNPLINLNGACKGTAVQLNSKSGKEAEIPSNNEGYRKFDSSKERDTKYKCRDRLVSEKGRLTYVDSKEALNLEHMPIELEDSGKKSLVINRQTNGQLDRDRRVLVDQISLLSRQKREQTHEITTLRYQLSEQAMKIEQLTESETDLRMQLEKHAREAVQYKTSRDNVRSELQKLQSKYKSLCEELEAEAEARYRAEVSSNCDTTGLSKELKTKDNLILNLQNQLKEATSRCEELQSSLLRQKADQEQGSFLLSESLVDLKNRFLEEEQHSSSEPESKMRDQKKRPEHQSHTLQEDMGNIEKKFIALRQEKESLIKTLLGEQVLSKKAHEDQAAQQVALRAAETELREIRNHSELARKQLVEKQQELSNMISHMAGQDKELTELRANRINLNTQISRMRQEQLCLEQNVDSMNRCNTQLQEDLTAHQKQLELERGAKEDTQRQLRDSQQIFEDVEAKNARLAFEIEQLHAVQKNHEETNLAQANLCTKTRLELEHAQLQQDLMKEQLNEITNELQRTVDALGIVKNEKKACVQRINELEKTVQQLEIDQKMLEEEADIAKSDLESNKHTLTLSLEQRAVEMCSLQRSADNLKESNERLCSEALLLKAELGETNEAFYKAEGRLRTLESTKQGLEEAMKQLQLANTEMRRTLSDQDMCTTSPDRRNDIAHKKVETIATEKQQQIESIEHQASTKPSFEQRRDETNHTVPDSTEADDLSPQLPEISVMLATLERPNREAAIDTSIANKSNQLYKEHPPRSSIYKQIKGLWNRHSRIKQPDVLEPYKTHAKALEYQLAAIKDRMKHEIQSTVEIMEKRQLDSEQELHNQIAELTDKIARFKKQAKEEKAVSQLEHTNDQNIEQDTAISQSSGSERESEWLKLSAKECKLETEVMKLRNEELKDELQGVLDYLNL